MFSHNKRDNLPIVNYCSFILTGILFIFKIIKSFWYPDEYYERKNNHTRFNKIKHYIGLLIIVISIFLVGVVFFNWNQSILFEIIIKISILMNIMVYCRKYLM